MKRALAIIGALLLIPISIAVITATPLVGEVVTLHSRAENGDWQTTPLWIVDPPEGAYLRAGNPEESGWVTRIRANPEIRLERNGELRDVQLIADPPMQDRIHELMSARYGWANSFVGLMSDPSSALPYRIEAATTAEEQQ